MKKIAQNIRIINNVVKLSARQYILSSEEVSLIRQIIQTLTSRYKKSEVKIVEQLHEQYYDLKTSLVKAKIEEWISEWENLRSKMISHDLKDTFENDVIFVHEFLRAGKKWMSIFCETWVIQHEAAEKPLNFFKTIRAYRNAYEEYLKDEESIRDHANAVTLQDKTQNQAQSDQKSKNQNIKNNLSKKKARKCVCEDIHESDECSYIVSSARTSDWTEDKKILDQIKQRFQEKLWILRAIKRICNINLLNEMSEKERIEMITNISSTEMKSNMSSFWFDNFSFANIVLRESISLSKSVIYDSRCSDSLTYDKNRFLREIKSVSKDIWIKISNDRMKMKNYDIMQMLDKLIDKIIKMKFANIVYVLITSMTLVSFIKLIKEEYDRDMHIKILVHVATEKKVCDIEKHFGVMILDYNLINESTAIVKMTIPKINEMLTDQASKNQKREKKMFCSITNSESITHEKSGREHIMKLNQSDERQRKKPSLNNSHSSRQIDSGNDEDHFIKTSNTNDDLKKQAKSSDITHHKNSNRIEKAWWRFAANEVQITLTNEVKKRLSIEGFSDDQYEFSKHVH